MVAPIQEGTVDVEGGNVEELRQRAAYALEVKRQIRGVTEQTVEEYNTSPLVTATYNLQRLDGGSDYSEVKLLAQGFFFPNDWYSMDLLVNGSVSLYHDPDPDLSQDTVRDYGFTMGIEKALPNKLGGGLISEDDLSPIKLSLSGKVAQNEEIDDVIGSAEARLEVPLARGFTVPLTLTYSSRTDASTGSELRVNVGLNFDATTIQALAQLADKLRD